MVVLGVYLLNGRTIGAGDTFPAAYLPWSLLRQGNVDFDEFAGLHDARARGIFPLLDGVPYYLRHRDGHYLSAYNPSAGVLALPIYAVPIALGAPPEARWVDRLEKLSAAVITALSVVFLFGALRHVTSPGWSLAIALVYAFGTSSLSVSSQALWQHGSSQLFLCLGLYTLVRGLRDDRYLGYAGLPLAAAVLMRSTDLVLVLPAMAWIVYAHRARARSLALWTLPPIAAALIYHVVSATGPDRDLGHTTAPAWAFFTQMPLTESLPGLLVSPSRGLFVYSPVLLFSVVGMIMVWRDGPALWKALTLGPPLGILVVGKWLMWWGGHSWGPRLLADLAPILCFFLYPLTTVLDRRRLVKALFIVLALWSVAAHALGAWRYDRRWDTLVAERIHADLAAWRESPLAFYGREVLLHLTGRGSDGTTSGGRAAAFAVDRTRLDVMSGERVQLPISVSNVGHDVWPAATPGDRGAVRLAWRWDRGDQRQAAGREALLADMPPGSTTRFTARIMSPLEPGDYTLILGMMSDPGEWFGDHGPGAARIAVRVFPLEVARMLSAPIDAPAGTTPRVRIATDRPSYRRDDTLRLNVTVRYPHHPRSFDLYYVFEPPHGPVWFFDGLTLPRPANPDWILLGRGLPLPARMDGRFALPLATFSHGTYRWHVLLTPIGSYRPVARATTTFAVGP